MLELITSPEYLDSVSGLIIAITGFLTLVLNAK